MHILLTAWVTGFLAVTPSPEHAQETFGNGLRAARALIERQQYEQALKQVRDLRGSGLDSEQEMTIALYEGLILANMGPRQQREALAAFRSALLQDPQVRLPLKAPARIVREFEEVRARVLYEKRMAFAASRSGVPPLEMLSAEEETSPHILIPAIGGGGLVATGGILLTLARKEQSRLQNADPDRTTDEELQRMSSQGKTYQTLGFGLLGAGVVGLGVATMLYLRREPQVPVTLGVGVNGTSIVAHGRWP